MYNIYKIRWERRGKLLYALKNYYKFNFFTILFIPNLTITV